MTKQQQIQDRMQEALNTNLDAFGWMDNGNEPQATITGATDAASSCTTILAEEMGGFAETLFELPITYAGGGLFYHNGKPISMPELVTLYLNRDI